MPSWEPAFDQMAQDVEDWSLDISNGLQGTYLSLLDTIAHNDQLYPTLSSLFFLWWNALLFCSAILQPRKSLQDDAAGGIHLECIKALNDVSWTVNGQRYFKWHKAIKATTLQDELNRAFELMMVRSGEDALVVLRAVMWLS